MKIFATFAFLLAGITVSSATTANPQEDDERNLQSSSSSAACYDIQGDNWGESWNNGLKKDCAGYDQAKCAEANLHGKFYLNANTACCACGGGYTKGANAAATTATGWQLFRQHGWKWTVRDIELYSSGDCAEHSRISTDGTDISFSSSGYSYPKDQPESVYWRPEKAFMEGTQGWGGVWDEADGSLFIGVEFPTAQSVRCLRIKQNNDAELPFLIRTKESPASEWKNLQYLQNGAGDQDANGFQTVVIDGTIPHGPLPFSTTSSINKEECAPDTTVMIFSGHDKVESVNKGTIDITWSPAFVYNIDETSETNDKFVDCGDYSYTVVVAEGEKEFSVDMSHAELVAMARGSNTMDVFETKERQLSLTDRKPGNTYTVLVLANTDNGNESFNRATAVIDVSSQDPILRDENIEMLIMPEPSDKFSVSFSNDVGDGKFTVTVAGNIPTEYKTVKTGNFITAYGNDGLSEANAKMLRVTSVLRLQNKVQLGAVAVDLTDIFEELDASYDINGDGMDDDDEDADADDLIDLDVDDETLIAELEALPDKVKKDICIMVTGVEDLSCFDRSNGRMLSDAQRKLFFKKLWRSTKKTFKKVKKAAKKIATGVRKLAKKVKKTVKKVIKAIKANKEISITLGKTLTFLDVEKTAKLSCERDGSIAAADYESLFEVGVQFDLSTQARFKVRVSLARGLDNALFSLFGGFGAMGYVQLGQTAAAEFKPDPITLFKMSRTRIFWAGKIPIVITNRPKLDAIVEASAAVEAEAQASAQIGWDYELTFEYDGTKSRKEDRFKKTEKFEKRETLAEDPEFSLRVEAAAQIGLQFSWDIILYGTVQGTLAADVGLATALEVGTNLEAIVVSHPYFYTLDAFEVEAYLEIRAEFSFNNAIGELIKDLADAVTGIGPTCGFSIEGKGYQIPTVDGDVQVENLPSVPSSLEKAVDFAKKNNKFKAATDLTLEELNRAGEINDEFAEQASKVVDLISQFEELKASFTIHKASYPLLELPEVKINLEEAKTCQGNDAIVLKFSATTDGIKGGKWFGNFDGTILSEDSDWIMDNASDPSAVTVRLPRSSTKNSMHQIDEGMELILRTTPRVMPWPENSMFTKTEVDVTTIVPFECCSDSDCQGESTCGSNGMCSTADSNLAAAAAKCQGRRSIEYCLNECELSQSVCQYRYDNYPYDNFSPQ